MPPLPDSFPQVSENPVRLVAGRVRPDLVDRRARLEPHAPVLGLSTRRKRPSLDVLAGDKEGALGVAHGGG
jgi:hypothetical protein